MAAPLPSPAAPERERARFPTTQWSLVMSAGRRGGADACQALEQLCRAYWFPLYTFIRRRGFAAAEAEDLTQEFFRQLLDSERLARADPAAGRFRGYLVAMLRSFLAHEWEKTQAQKRGGGQAPLPLDLSQADARYRREPIDPGLTPEQAFDRAWTLQLLDQVLQTVHDEYAATGRAELFGRLRGFVWGDSAGVSQESVAAELGLSTGALKVAVHRLRQKVRERLREAVAATLAAPGETEAELRHLLAALGSGSRHGM